MWDMWKETLRAWQTANLPHYPAVSCRFLLSTGQGSVCVGLGEVKIARSREKLLPNVSIIFLFKKKTYFWASAFVKRFIVT